MILATQKHILDCLPVYNDRFAREEEGTRGVTRVLKRVTYDGWRPTHFPSEVDTSKDRKMKASEKTLFLKYMQQYERRLKARYVRAFRGFRGVGADEVDNAYQEGLFAATHCLCRCRKKWREAEFYTNWHLTVWYGMIATRIATVAYARNERTRNLKRTVTLCLTPQEAIIGGLVLNDETEQAIVAVERKASDPSIDPNEKKIAGLLLRLDPVKFHICWRYFVDEADTGTIADELDRTPSQIGKMRLAAAVELRRGLGLPAFPVSKALYSFDEICLTFDMSPTTLYRMERDGEIPPPLKLSGVKKYGPCHRKSIEAARSKLRPERYYAIADIIRILGVSKTTISRLTRAGEFPKAIRDGQGHWRYTQEHIEVAKRLAETRKRRAG